MHPPTHPPTHPPAVHGFGAGQVAQIGTLQGHLQADTRSYIRELCHGQVSMLGTERPGGPCRQDLAGHLQAGTRSYMWGYTGWCDRSGAARRPRLAQLTLGDHLYTGCMPGNTASFSPPCPLLSHLAPLPPTFPSLPSSHTFQVSSCASSSICRPRSTEDPSSPSTSSSGWLPRPSSSSAATAASPLDGESSAVAKAPDGGAVSAAAAATRSGARTLTPNAPSKGEVRIGGGVRGQRAVPSLPPPPPH